MWRSERPAAFGAAAFFSGATRWISASRFSSCCKSMDFIFGTGMSWFVPCGAGLSSLSTSIKSSWLNSGSFRLISRMWEVFCGMSERSAWPRSVETPGGSSEPCCARDTSRESNSGRWEGDTCANRSDWNENESRGEWKELKMWGGSHTEKFGKMVAHSRWANFEKKTNQILQKLQYTCIRGTMWYVCECAGQSEKVRFEKEANRVDAQRRNLEGRNVPAPQMIKYESFLANRNAQAELRHQTSAAVGAQLRPRKATLLGTPTKGNEALKHRKKSLSWFGKYGIKFVDEISDWAAQRKLIAPFWFTSAICFCPNEFLLEQCAAPAWPIKCSIPK